MVVSAALFNSIEPHNLTHTLPYRVVVIAVSLSLFFMSREITAQEIDSPITQVMFCVTDINRTSF